MRHLHRLDAVGDDRAALRRATWALAWPVIFSFSIESIVGLCDALMVGRLGATAVAAVGVGVHVLSVFNVAMFAVGTGSLAIVARHWGAGERDAAAETLRQSILAAFGLSVLIAVPVAVWPHAVLGLFRVAPEVVETAAGFVRVVMLAVPPDAALFVIATGLRAAGDTRTPLLIGIATALVSVSVAYTLIFGVLGLPALGVRGAAWGTVAGFTAGALLGLAVLASGRIDLHVRWRGVRVDPAVVRRVLRVGYPAALEHVLMQAGFLAYMVFAAHYGTKAVAAYFIGVRILALAFLPGLGFGAAAGTLVGQSLGARRPEHAVRSGWMALELAMVLMTVGGAVLVLFARPVARLFVDDEAVVADAVAFIRVLGLSQPLMAADFTLGGALRGAGDTRFPLLVVIVAFYIGRLGSAALVAYWLDWGLLWVWLALIVDYVVRAVLKGWRFHSGVWQHVRL